MARSYMVRYKDKEYVAKTLRGLCLKVVNAGYPLIGVCPVLDVMDYDSGVRLYGLCFRPDDDCWYKVLVSSDAELRATIDQTMYTIPPRDIDVVIPETILPNGMICEEHFYRIRVPRHKVEGKIVSHRGDRPNPERWVMIPSTQDLRDNSKFVR